MTSIFLTIIGYINDRNANEAGYGPFFPPLMVGFTVAIITASFSPLSSTCMNPARDLGPRLVTYIAGKLPNLISQSLLQVGENLPSQAKQKTSGGLLLLVHY